MIWPIIPLLVVHKQCLREHPLMTSTKSLDFWPPPPLSAFGSDLYYKIHTNSLTMFAFPWPRPPLMQTSYLEAPTQLRSTRSCRWHSLGARNKHHCTWSRGCCRPHPLVYPVRVGPLRQFFSFLLSSQNKVWVNIISEKNYWPAHLYM